MDREKPIILINDLPPFLKRLYRENPYCVLGLAAGAPRRDAEDAMRRMKTFEMLPVEKRTPAAAERILKAPALSGLEWPERSSAVYNSLLPEFGKQEHKLLWFQDLSLLERWQDVTSGELMDTVRRRKAGEKAQGSCEYDLWLALLLRLSVFDRDFEKADEWKILFQETEYLCSREDDDFLPLTGGRFTPEEEQAIQDDEEWLTDKLERLLADVFRPLYPDSEEALLRLLVRSGIPPFLKEGWKDRLFADHPLELWSIPTKKLDDRQLECRARAEAERNGEYRAYRLYQFLEKRGSFEGMRWLADFNFRKNYLSSGRSYLDAMLSYRSEHALTVSEESALRRVLLLAVRKKAAGARQDYERLFGPLPAAAGSRELEARIAAFDRSSAGRDPEEEDLLFHQTALRKDAVSISNTGYMADYGIGTPWHPGEALRCYRSAACLQDDAACSNIANLLPEGSLSQKAFRMEAELRGFLPAGREPSGFWQNPIKNQGGRA